MVIDKTIFLTNAPSTGDVIWAKPVGDNIILHMYNRGKWVPVSGGGSSSSIDMSKAIMINAETDFEALKETIGISTANKLGIDTHDDPIFDNMTQEEFENFKETYAEEALALGLTTENHGKVVETVFDERTGFVRMLCEDGYILRTYDDGRGIVLDEREIPPYARYQYDGDDVIDLASYKRVPFTVVHNLTQVIMSRFNSCLYYLSYANDQYTSKTGEDPVLNMGDDEIFCSSWILGRPFNYNNLDLGQIERIDLIITPPQPAGPVIS